MISERFSSSTDERQTKTSHTLVYNTQYTEIANQQLEQGV